MVSLDLLRGWAVGLMIIVNATSAYDVVPWWLKHASGNGYTIADLVAPLFLFALGIAYHLSFSRRRGNQGTKKTVFHFLRRYSLIFCFGFFGELVALGKLGWGVLAMIGGVGIYALGFMFLCPSYRLLLGLGSIIAYQSAVWLQLPILFFPEDGLGGPLAIPAWGFIVIVASAVGSWIEGKSPATTNWILSRWATILTLSGLFLQGVLPLNKHEVSFSYILLSVGLSCLTLLIFCFCHQQGVGKISFLGILGRNPLIIYMLSSLLILGFNALIPVDAHGSIVILGVTTLLAIAIGVGKLLSWKKLDLK
jgi:predicted acyltransferase